MTDPSAIRVVAGSPTDEETAAIAALFSRLLLERRAVSLPLPAEHRRSAWQRSTRSLRGPLHADREWRDR